MPLYETVVIARSEITQAQADAVADAVIAQLETDGGAVKKREYWGLAVARLPHQEESQGALHPARARCAAAGGA